MKSARVLPLLFLSWTLAVAACATPESIDEDAGGTGGTSATGGGNGATGGTTGSGGTKATGGTTGTGGSIATGGTTGTGGTKATGGATGTGGSVATGGTTGTGGTNGTGGTKATGGATGTGGAQATGGTTGTGGTPATGGTTGTGGTKATGGTTGTGGTKATGGTTGTGGTPATGGTTGTGGTPATGGTTGSNAVCKFASGLNVAWVNFANDIPNPNLTTFKTIFTNSAAVGGRVIRWWFHTNGTVTPGYDSSGMAKPLTSGAINDVVTLANTAHTAGVALNISLWSFDMLQGGENISTTLRTQNQNLLTVDANRNAYVTNVLIPLVTALKGNAGVYSYEIFNEPEGMTNQHGWTKANGGTEVDQSYIQKTVNVLAAAIHSTDANARVTSGAQTFGTCSTGVSGMSNLYSNSALTAAGGMSNGTLDFYEVHYYTSNGANYSAFTHPASHWGLDKNVVMGEFYAITTDGVNGPDTYTNLYTNGYNGAWAWNYKTNDNSGTTTAWPTMKTPMQNLYNAQMATLNACP